VLGERLAKQPGTHAEKMNGLCELLFSRPAGPADLALCRQAVPDPTNAEDWLRLCQVLICSNEFMYVD
jgi:hypothetical protein